MRRFLDVAQTVLVVALIGIWIGSTIYVLISEIDPPAPTPTPRPIDIRPVTLPDGSTCYVLIVNRTEPRALSCTRVREGD